MKTAKYLVVMLLAALTMSCSKTESYVNIDSLSKMGTEFSCSDEIPVWMCVETDDLDNTEYEWGCSAGEFYGPSDVVRTVWIAPMMTGEFDLWCKVTSGNKSATRSTVMNVTNFFLSTFETDPDDASYSFTTSNVDVLWIEPTAGLSGSGEMSLIGNSTSGSSVSYGYSTSNTSFVKPYRAAFDFAWREYYDINDNDYPLEIQMTIARPSSKPAYYYSSVKLRVYPQREYELQDDLEEGYDPADVSNYKPNVQIYYTYYNVAFGTSKTTTAYSSYHEEFYLGDGALAEDGRGMTNIALEIWDDYTLAASIIEYGETSRKVVCSSTSLKDTEGGVDQDFNPTKMNLLFYPDCNIFIDNFEMNNITE